MSDRRHQKDGRSNWNQKFQTFGNQVFGTWTFYRMNLTSEKIETIKEGRAMLEIGTARVVESTRSSKARREHFGYSYSSTDPTRDVEFFDAIAELKIGARIFTPDFVYSAIFTAPAKADATFQAAA